MSLFTATELADMRAMVASGFDRTLAIVRSTATPNGLLGATVGAPATIASSGAKVKSATTGAGSHRAAAGADQNRSRHEWEIELEWDAPVRDGDRLEDPITGDAYGVVGVDNRATDRLRTLAFCVTAA